MTGEASFSWQKRRGLPELGESGWAREHLCLQIVSIPSPRIYHGY